MASSLANGINTGFGTYFTATTGTETVKRKGEPPIVFQTDGGRKELVGFRQVHSGAGYCCCSPLEAHFGLGKAAVTYRVEVAFPVSRRVVVRENVKAGQRLVVTEE